MHYTCEECGCQMDYVKKTSKGEKYECPYCGNTGYVEGMEESGSPIDEEMFGF